MSKLALIVVWLLLISWAGTKIMDTAWWRRRQRKIDLEVLWPTCVRSAGGDVELAKVPFAWHVFHDPAWTTDFSKEELIVIVDRIGREDGDTL